MPKNKTAKKKVKAVVVPDSDAAAGISRLEKSEKLDTYRQQFCAEVESQIQQMRKDCEAACKSIEDKGKTIINNLGADGKLTVEDYRRKISRSTSERRSKEVLGLDVSAILKEVQIPNVVRRAEQPSKRRKMPGFATPAPITDTSMWTATPKETPLFDKRLLNVTTGKPTTFSLNGQFFDTAKMDPASKRQLASDLEAMVTHLKQS